MSDLVCLTKKNLHDSCRYVLVNLPVQVRVLYVQVYLYHTMEDQFSSDKKKTKKKEEKKRQETKAITTTAI